MQGTGKVHAILVMVWLCLSQSRLHAQVLAAAARLGQLSPPSSARFSQGGGGWAHAGCRGAVWTPSQCWGSVFFCVLSLTALCFHRGFCAKSIFESSISSSWAGCRCAPVTRNRQLTWRAPSTSPIAPTTLVWLLPFFQTS